MEWKVVVNRCLSQGMAGREYAVRFFREGDRRVVCEVKVGETPGMSPKDMAQVAIGTCSHRARIDQFDKGIAQVISLSNAMRRANRTGDREIAAAHRRAMSQQSMKTKVHLV